MGVVCTWPAGVVWLHELSDDWDAFLLCVTMRYTFPRRIVIEFPESKSPIT